MNLTVSQSQGKPGDSITISWQTTADGGTLSITDGQNTQDITGQASGSVTWALNAPAGGKQYYHCTQQGDTLIDEAYATVSVIADAPPAATTAAPASSSASSNSTPAATTTANSSPASSGPSTPAATTTSKSIERTARLRDHRRARFHTGRDHHLGARFVDTRSDHHRGPRRERGRAFL